MKSKFCFLPTLTKPNYKTSKLTFSKNRDSVPTPCLLTSAIEESFKFSNLGFFCSIAETEMTKQWYEKVRKYEK